MHRRLGVVVLLASLSSCNLGAAADTAERVARFEAKLSEELGAEVELQCPPMIDNRYHYCTAVVVGQEDLAFPVRVQSRGEDLDYTTKLWVSGTRMARLGKHALEEKLDLTVDSLDCPMISHLPEGSTVRCEASTEGITVQVEVSMVVKVRKLSFEPVEGVVFGEQAARVAHETLLERGMNVEVKCPWPVLVSVPGKRFECEAVMPDETPGTVHYLITSADGTFELGTEPPTAASADRGAASAGAPAGSDHQLDHHGDAPT